MAPALPRPLRWLLVGLAGLMGLLIIATGALWWWAGQEGSLDWMLDRARAASGSKLVVDGAHGSLREEVAIDSLAYEDAGLALEARQVTLRIDWLQVLRLSLGMEYVRAASVAIRLPPDSGEPPKPPSAFPLPVPVRVARIEIGTASIVSDSERDGLQSVSLGYAGGPFSHEVHDLRARFAARGASGKVQLNGSIGALNPFVTKADLSLQLEQPKAASIKAKLQGTLEHPRVAAEVNAGSLNISAQAALAPFSPLRLQSLKASTDHVDLPAVMAGLSPKTPVSWPHTALEIKLELAETEPGRWSGTVNATNSRAGPLDKALLPITKLDTRFSSDLATLRLSDLRIALPERGAIAGSGELARQGSQLALQTRNIDLRRLYSSLTTTDLSGPIELALEGTRQAARAELVQQDMALAFDAMRSGDQIDVRSFRASARGGEATGSATVRMAKAAEVSASVALSRLDPSRFGDYPEGTLNGNTRLEARLGGGLERRVAARWTLSDSELFGQPLASTGSGTLVGEGAALRARDLNARISLGTTKAELRGAIGAEQDRLSWKLEAPQLARLPRNPWIQWPDPLSGSLAAEGTLTGSVKQWQVSATARVNALRGPDGMSADVITARVTSGSSLQSPFDVAIEGQRLRATGVSLARMTVFAKGTTGQHELRVTARNELLDMEARLQGAYGKEAQGAEGPGWSGRLISLSNSGQYPLQLTGPAPLEILSNHIRLGRLEARFGDGRLLIRDVSWTRGPKPGTGRLISSGEFNDVPAAWIAAPAGLHSVRTTMRIGGEWSLESTPQLNGRVVLRRTGGDVYLEAAGVEMGLRNAVVESTFTNGALAAQANVDARVGTVSATVRTTPEPGVEGLGFAPRSPLTLDARIALVDVKPLLASFQTQGRIAGRANILLHATGTLGKPQFEGTVEADGLGYDLPPWGLSVHDGRLRARLQGDALQISELSLKAGEGGFTARGTLPLRFADGGTNVTWQADRFGLLNRPGIRLSVNGSGTAGYDGKRFTLKGSLAAQRGNLEWQERRLPTLADDIVVNGREPPPPRARVRLPLDLDLLADLGNSFFLKAYGFNGRLEGKLQLTTDADGEPRAEGRIEAANATFEAYGQRLQVQEGTAIFNGPIDNPALQVTAWRRNQLVEAGVQIKGSVQDPRVQLVSEPPVPEGERLSWLVLGRAPGDAGVADIALLQAAAGALFSRRNSPSPQQRIVSAFGLDELTVRTSSTLPSQVVAVGKRLSDRLYISYEQAVGVVAASLVKLDFSLTRRFSLRAETGTSSGVGVVYRYSWD